MSGDKSIRWYLAGPMTGHPSFNYPQFNEVAARLRAEGYNVVNPAEMDSPEARRIMMNSPYGSEADLPPGTTWGRMLARDIAVLVDECDGIIFLPQWWKSRGARAEAMLGLLCKKRFAAWRDSTGSVVDYNAMVVADWLGAWLEKVDCI